MLPEILLVSPLCCFLLVEHLQRQTRSTGSLQARNHCYQPTYVRRQELCFLHQFRCSHSGNV